MLVENITKDKNLMRITWLAFYLSPQVKEDEILLSLSFLLEDYFIKYDKIWLDEWVEAVEISSKTGDGSPIINMLAEATSLGRMISILEDSPEFKNTLN